MKKRKKVIDTALTYSDHFIVRKDFPHTIQSPPIKSFTVNGLHVAEIGSAVLSFHDVPYLANIGCHASMTEALSQGDHTIPIRFEPPFLFSMKLCEGYIFHTDTEIQAIFPHAMAVTEQNSFH